MAVATVVSKLLEHFILSCVSPCLGITDNPLGFKAGLNTDQCTFFKSVRTSNSFQFLCLEALDWQASLKKTRLWLWNQKLVKCLLKCLGQIQCAKVPQSLSWNQGFFDTLAWGAIVPHFLHLPRQTNHFRHPSHKPVEQRKEMTFSGRLANVRATVVRSSCCPSSQNLTKWLCMKSR